LKSILVITFLGSGKIHLDPEHYKIFNFYP
jgi:hypothetical protein